MASPSQPPPASSSPSAAAPQGERTDSSRDNDSVAGAPHRALNCFPGLGRIVLFFTVVVVTAYALDATISRGLKQIQTSKFGSLNRVMSGAVDAEIVINGSSRALVHYDPRIIQQVTGYSAYNLGMNGVLIDVQLAVLKSYLQRNSKPKIIIQNLESFTFKTTKPGEIYDPAAYLPYLKDEVLYSALRAIDPAVWKWRHIPLYGYVVEDMTFTWAWGLLGNFGHMGRENYFQGFNPRHLRWTMDFDQFRTNIGVTGVVDPIESSGVELVAELIRHSTEAGIRLILVYSPVYHEMQALEKNRPAIFAEFERLAREGGVEFWDYSQHSLTREKEYFYNSQHLNANGAHLFSQALALRLKQAGLGEPQSPQRSTLGR
jgi:hypothetical protein